MQNQQKDTIDKSQLQMILSSTDNSLNSID